MSAAATRDLGLPHGCIGPGALRGLADALDRLTAWHASAGGGRADRPCLRRLESNGDHITAHVSTGPDVGGSWTVLEFVDGSWLIRTG